MEGVVGIAPSRMSCLQGLLVGHRGVCDLTTNELLKFSLLRGGCASNEFGFEGVVGVLYWWLQEKVPDFCCKFWAE